MSLEAAIEKLTNTFTSHEKAVMEQNELLKQVIEGQARNLEGIQKIASGKAAAPAAAAAKTTKAAEKPAEKAAPAPTPAPAEPAAAAAPAAAQEDFSGEDGFANLRKLCGEYLTVSDAAEQGERKQKFAALVKHVGAGKLTEVPEARRAEFAGWVKTLAAGEDLPEIFGDDMLG